MPSQLKKRKSDGRRRWNKARERDINLDFEGCSLGELIGSVPSLPLYRLYLLVAEAMKEENVELQQDLISACLARILYAMNPGRSRNPHLAQVRTLRRLIFGKGDTLLITKTGFGKSLIFHAYSILTQRITLQIIPLSKLGDEQFHDIKRLPGTRPCLLTSESKQEQRDLVTRFQNLEFTHVLLGPEQASSEEFRTALKRPELQARIGLVAIDECHLVKQWETFRPHFTMLGQLRQLLRQDIVWFGCSATLDLEVEQHILQSAGFRTVGPNYYETEVIRTSINRLDISLSICSIPKGKLSSFDSLYFLLDNAFEDDQPTPARIPKTIVFLDSRKDVAKAAAFLQTTLLTKAIKLGQEYSYSVQGERLLCVYDIIQIFTAHVAQNDKDERYAEFLNPQSTIRIMIATTALGIGVNIPDVERVVLWKFPIDKSVAEHWQRIGRGGRGEGRTSHAFIFLPYWVFDSQGNDRLGTPSTKTGELRKPQSRRQAQSRLYSSFAPEHLSDTESIASVVESTQSVELAPDSIRYWTKDEARRRLELPAIWRAIANRPCHRTPFLEALGEGRLPSGEAVIVSEASSCCNGCNPLLTPNLTPMPKKHDTITKPRLGTPPGFALELIDRWTTGWAEACYTHLHRRFPLPASAFIQTRLRWQLAYLYGPDGQTQSWWSTLTIDQLATEVDLTSWSYRAQYGDLLVRQLQGFTTAVLERVQEARAQRKQIQDQKRLGRETSPRTPEPRGILTTHEYNTQNRLRDNILSKQVARHQLYKTAQRLSNPSQPLYSTTERLAQIQVQTSQVDDFISSLPSSNTLSSRNLEAIEEVPETQLDERIPETQEVPETQLDERIPETQDTPSRRRKALEERVPYQQAMISFSPTSRNGRKRRMTSKGKENFCISIDL